MQTGWFWRYKLHHVLCWLLVFGTWFFLRLGDYSSWQKTAEVTALKVADLALLVYITNYILLPRLFYRKKYVLFTVLLVLMIVVSSILKMKLLGQILHDPQLFSLQGNLKRRIYDNMIPHFFLVIAGAAIKLMFDYTRLQRRLAETAREKAEAELNFLKSQINPHFLFNSLNSVYFLIDKSNTEARRALHQFSDMLRFQLYEANGTRIPIEKELRYLSDYMDLQRLRKETRYEVSLLCEPDVKGFAIEPLLLIPFVENAFKHISHFEQRSNYIRVALTKNDGWLHFTVQNTTENALSPGEPGGIGLANVKRRLELLYPGRYRLQLSPGNDHYQAELYLQIDDQAGVNHKKH